MVLEDLPRLSLAYLRQESKFPAERGYIWRYMHHDIPIAIRMGEIALRIRWGRNGKIFQQYIDIGYRQLKFGKRAYLYCPYTDKLTSNLYLHNSWVSAEALGISSVARSGRAIERQVAEVHKIIDRLHGADGMPRARGAHRERLVAKVSRIPLARMIEPSLGMTLQTEAVRRRRRTARPFRSSAKKGAFSTAQAYKRACEVFPGQEALYAQVAAACQPSSYEALGDAAALKTRPLKILEEAAALDCDFLTKQRGDQSAWCHYFVWPGVSMEGFSRLLVVLDHRDTAQAYLRVVGKTDTAHLDQSIRLAPSHPNSPRRWLMICPVTAKRSSVLFLRDGFFASAVAQRLRHRGQW